MFDEFKTTPSNSNYETKEDLRSQLVADGCVGALEDSPNFFRDSHLECDALSGARDYAPWLKRVWYYRGRRSR